MSDTPITDAPVADAPGAAAGSAGAGSRLRAAREAKGLSTGAIATQLNLDLRTVEALEQDNHARLPAPIFVRGYLRNYARLLGLPEDDVLDAYQAQAPAEPGPRRVGLPRRRQRSFHAPRVPWRGLVALLLLGLLGVLAWEFGPAVMARFSGGTPPPAEAPAALALPGQGDETAGSAGRAPAPGMLELPLPPAHDAPADIGEPIPLDEVEPVLPPEAEMEPGARPAAEAAPAPPEAEALPPASAAEAATPVEPAVVEPPAVEPAVDRLRLDLRFTDDSWVEISTADGTRLLYGLMRRDEQRSVAGRAPLQLLLGNAAAVELRVDGAPFDLTPHMRGAVARFRLDPGG